MHVCVGICGGSWKEKKDKKFLSKASPVSSVAILSDKAANVPVLLCVAFCRDPHIAFDHYAWITLQSLYFCIGYLDEICGNIKFAALCLQLAGFSLMCILERVLWPVSQPIQHRCTTNNCTLSYFLDVGYWIAVTAAVLRAWLSSRGLTACIYHKTLQISMLACAQKLALAPGGTWVVVVHWVKALSLPWLGALTQVRANNPLRENQ